MGCRRTQTINDDIRERKGRWLQRWPLSYNQACCFPLRFIKCWVVQAFSISSNLDPKLVPKNWIRTRWEKFALVYHSFCCVDRITNRATARIARNPFRLSLFHGGSILSMTYPESSGTNWFGSMRARTSRRASKTGEPICSGRRHILPLPQYPCSNKNNVCQAHFGKEVTRSGPAVKEVRTWNCSRGSNLAPNSIGSWSPPTRSQNTFQVDPKQSPLLTPDMTFFEAKKSHWTDKPWERLCGTRRDRVLRAWAYFDFRLRGRTSGLKKPSQSYVSTPHPPTMIDAGMPTFRRASGSLNLASPSFHYSDVDSKPGHSQLAFLSSTTTRRGIVSALATVSEAR